MKGGGYVLEQEGLVHGGVGANDDQEQVQVQDVNNIDFHAAILQLLERCLDDSQMMIAQLRQRADYHHTQSRVLRGQRNRLIMAFIIFLPNLLGIVMKLVLKSYLK